MVALGRRAIKTVTLFLIGIMAVILTFIGVNEIYVLFGSGIMGIAIHIARRRHIAPAVIPAALLWFTTSDTTASDWRLFWIFLKVGAILYGSGYVLFAFLDAELVAKGFLSKQELIDAVAVGQLTPGPVFSAATFIGWQLGGIGGALAATVGIFLPSFLFVAFLNPLIPKLRNSDVMSAFLDTVNVTSVAIILVVVIEMAGATIQDWRTVLIAVVSFYISFRFRKLNTAFIVLGGAVLGYVLSLV